MVKNVNKLPQFCLNLFARVDFKFWLLLKALQRKPTKVVCKSNLLKQSSSETMRIFTHGAHPLKAGSQRNRCHIIHMPSGVRNMQSYDRFILFMECCPSVLSRLSCDQGIDLRSGNEFPLDSKKQEAPRETLSRHQLWSILWSPISIFDV